VDLKRDDVAFLHVAEWRDLGRGDALVDADDAVFKPLGDAPDAANVAAVKIGGEPPLSLPRLRGRVRVGDSLAILTTSSSLLTVPAQCSISSLPTSVERVKGDLRTIRLLLGH
jgi:hypothetical protein